MFHLLQAFKFIELIELIFIRWIFQFDNKQWTPIEPVEPIYASPVEMNSIGLEMEYFPMELNYE